MAKIQEVTIPISLDTSQAEQKLENLKKQLQEILELQEKIEKINDRTTTLF